MGELIATRQIETDENQEIQIRKVESALHFFSQTAQDWISGSYKWLREKIHLPEILRGNSQNSLRVQLIPSVNESIDFLLQDQEAFVTLETRNPYHAHPSKVIAEKSIARKKPEVGIQALRRFREIKKMPNLDDQVHAYFQLTSEMPTATVNGPAGEAGGPLAKMIERTIKAGFLPNMSAGCSAGAIASPLELAMSYGYIEPTDQSFKQISKYTFKLVKSLGALNLKVPKSSLEFYFFMNYTLQDIVRAKSASEINARSLRYVECLGEGFESMSIAHFPGLSIIATEFEDGVKPKVGKGNTIFFDSKSDLPLIYPIEASSSLYPYFRGVSTNRGVTLWDGAYSSDFLPVKHVLDQGAEFVLVRILRLGDPDKKTIKETVTGHDKVAEYDNIFGRATDQSIKDLLKIGDKHGRVIIDNNTAKQDYGLSLVGITPWKVGRAMMNAGKQTDQNLFPFLIASYMHPQYKSTRHIATRPA